MVYALILVPFLFVLLALFFSGTKRILSLWFVADPSRIVLVPLIFSLITFVTSIFFGQPDFLFFILVPSYFFLPVYLLSDEPTCLNLVLKPKTDTWKDILVVAIIWLPLEAASYTKWLEKCLGEMHHVVPWGSAVILGLMLFSTFKVMPGTKINFPKNWNDLVFPLIGLVVGAIILIPVGLWLPFMNPFSIPDELKVGGYNLPTIVVFPVLWLSIFFGVALPEEILFRSLIMTWLFSKFGESNKTLFVSALIFGLSHLNNVTKLRDGTILASPPNWDYVLIATIAGLIYGKVFQKSNTVFSSAGIHAAVNTIRHSFFG